MVRKFYFCLVALLMSLSVVADPPKSKLVIIGQSEGSTPVPNSILDEDVCLEGEYDESFLYINVANYYGEATISIQRSYYGRVLQSCCEEVNGESTIELGLSNLPQGTYIVKIRLHNEKTYTAILQH